MTPAGVETTRITAAFDRGYIQGLADAGRARGWGRVAFVACVALAFIIGWIARGA